MAARKNKDIQQELQGVEEITLERLLLETRFYGNWRVPSKLPPVIGPKRYYYH